MMHAILFLAAVLASRSLHVRCVGLEAYDIQGTAGIDSSGGGIRAKDGSFGIGFSMGSMVEELVPEERPPGFRTFKTVRIGNATLRYGFNVRKKLVQATLVGAPLDHTVNLVALPKDEQRLLKVAETLATAPCEVRVEGDHGF